MIAMSTIQKLCIKMTFSFPFPSMFQNQNKMPPSTNITFLGRTTKVKVNQAKDVKLQPS